MLNNVSDVLFVSVSIAVLFWCEGDFTLQNANVKNIEAIAYTLLFSCKTLQMISGKVAIIEHE